MSLRANPTVAERFWVVWSPDCGWLARKHESFDVAVRESERLAEKHKGLAFHVLEHVGFAQKVIPSTFTYVAD